MSDHFPWKSSDPQADIRHLKPGFQKSTDKPKLKKTPARLSEKVAREWYREWFDTPYYHILYQNRDEEEAENFIDRLLETLQPPPGASVLDLACGRGRYSRYLAKKGFDVVGLDLSENSIRYARQFERENLSFFRHDMRRPFRTNYFDYIFNFFTSFGYFESEKDDLSTLKNVAAGLKPGGVFVLDFLNSRYVVSRLQGKETKVIDGIRFDIEKFVENRYVFKTVNLEDNGKAYLFCERVRLFVYEDFQRLFQQAGLKITGTYGDYQLRPFDPENSPRLIVRGRWGDGEMGRL